MKKFKGFSIAGAIIGVAVVAFIIIASFLVIDGNNKATDFSKYDFTKVITADSHNGNIGDHVKGNPKAKAVFVEYADFQCSYCALMNPRINALVEELGDKVAVVYRNFLLSYHQNGTAAASAAEAASLQGYWKEYVDQLFNNQNEWYYATGSERTALFNKYFEKASNGKGDVDKFNADIASDAVSKKISFDMGIGQRVDISGTPSFYIEGQKFDFGNENGGQITVNGKTFVWDKQLTTEGFAKYFTEIVNSYYEDETETKTETKK